nr:MAG TPA: Baseplate structural protein [Caudoviricetes sp.]
MIYEKPKNEIFASDAKDGEIVEFPNVKRGWGVTENLGFIPPMEYFNAAFNRVDKSLAYQLQRGVGEWDKDLEYPIGAVVSLNGIIYIAKSQNINKKPSENKEIWHVIANKEWCEQTFLNKDEKIDAYNKTESDEKFALKDNLPELATEEKAGITKLKNSVTDKAEDATITEKAVVEFVQNHTSPALGVAQSWSDVTSSRDTNITYTNTTDKPIMVLISGEPNMEGDLFIFVNGVKIFTQELDSMAETSISFIVPPKATYRAEAYYGNGGSSPRKLENIFNSRYKLWAELR